MHEIIQILQDTLRHEIPLTQHLELQVVSYDQGRLTLQAPLAPNVNHKSTAFAGSLNSVATLAGWGICWLLLHEHGLSAQAVIQDSSCQYLRPVTSDFQAVCQGPDALQKVRLINSLTRHGKARLELSTEILTPEGVVVTFTGRYVLLAMFDMDNIK